jgi:hypothetical protein
MKTAAFVVLRIVALTIILFICFGVAAGVVGLAGNSQTSGQAGPGALPLLAVCFLETIVLTYLILRSHWTGWRLIAAVFFVFYGVTTFMAQIESAVFLTPTPSWHVAAAVSDGCPGFFIGWLLTPTPRFDQILATTPIAG